MISGKKLKLLEYLAKYKFASRKQLARVGLVNANSNFSGHRGIITVPEKLKLIGHSNLAKQERTSRPKKEYVYYLTKKGAMVLAEHYHRPLEKINFVKSDPVHSAVSLKHTVNAIWCQIECEIFAARNDLEIDFYIKETERIWRKVSEAKAERATRLMIGSQVLEPDAIFSVNNKLFTFEYENANNELEFLNKMEKHRKALDYRSLAAKAEVYTDDSRPKAHRNLIVFDNADIMQRHIEKAKKSLPAKYLKGNWFLFKHIDDILPKVQIEPQTTKYVFSEIKDYFAGWRNFSGEKVDLF